MKTKFSLVSTVYNEIHRLDQTIKNLEKQSLTPNEIVITDAGSNDGTYERLLKWVNESQSQITILQEVGCNVARGRNLAINKSSNTIIVSTDFGCIHSEDWLLSLIEPFNSDSFLEVVGGSYGVVEKEINTLPSRGEYIQQNGYNIPVNDYYTVTSRSIAYKKHVWEKLGGYPEWLTLAADDSTFWKLVKKRGFRYHIVKDPKVFWYRHNSLKGYINENKRYGKGDGESRTNFRNLLSHITETTVRYMFFLVLVVIFITKYFYLLPVLLVTSIGFRSYLRTIKNWIRLRSNKYHFGVLLYSLLLVEVLRFAYIRGYFIGLLYRNELQKFRSKNLLKELANHAG